MVYQDGVTLEADVTLQRRNNRIDGLRIHGRLVRNQSRIKVARRDFYKDFYHQETSPNIGFQDGLVRQITEEEAIGLKLMPTAEEIRMQCRICESTKAPGCDGYNMNFIKKYWDEVGKDFIEAVMEFFRSARLPKDSNVTWVALAPKFVGATEIKDLRPISMVGCVYKVISKVLVQRMRHVMSGLVEEETIRNYKRLLHYFEMMSGLNINFEKSSFIPVNCEQCWTQQMCHLLGCKEASLPVRYLGISVGANPRLVKTWKPVIDKVEGKLSLWKAKTLNKVGKLVLIKSILNSLPIYYLSLYKMSKTVAEKLSLLQRQFLWSNEDGKVGMPLVRWEVVMAPRKAGGFGVGDAVIRNTALLFKWWWSFSKEDCPLWKRIVCSCHNMNPFEMLCG
ncbi:uncharacterized protein [Arachis hypogaea]|uniref:uncharacterized protein n=1 Tax=Arachis hypogaea TaxID=3818 RepID=UPI003B221D85